MITTIIEWHDPAEELPEKSGYYLVLKYSGRITELCYSSKHKLFNAIDEETEAEAQKCAICCNYWADVPKLTETESEDE